MSDVSISSNIFALFFFYCLRNSFLDTDCVPLLSQLHWYYFGVLWMWCDAVRKGKISIILRLNLIWASLVAQTVKNPAMQETWVRSLGWTNPGLVLGWSPGGRHVLLPGQRSLVDHSPKGHKESDMTEQINTGHRIKSHNFSHNFSVPESSGYDLQKLFFFLLFKNILPPFMWIKRKVTASLMTQW